MDHVAARQAGFNATSRGQWDGFASHRRGVTGLLTGGMVAGGSRVCILGAGNANDLEFPSLLDAHREVHLVDLDAEALSLGASRQGVADHPRLHRHGGVDLTSTLGVLSGWTPLSQVRPADLEALATWPAERVPTALPGPFDVVASTCLLTQIQETTVHTLGPGHDRVEEAESAIRAGHLRLLARLTAPGGTALLITEVVSSDTLPGLAGLPAEGLAGLLPGLKRAGNHFRGTHPFPLLAEIRDDATVGHRIERAGAIAPWRWGLHGRTYLVSGVAFRLRAG